MWEGGRLAFERLQQRAHVDLTATALLGSPCGTGTAFADHSWQAPWALCPSAAEPKQAAEWLEWSTVGLKRLVQNSETLTTWAAITLMTRRLTRSKKDPARPLLTPPLSARVRWMAYTMAATTAASTVTAARATMTARPVRDGNRSVTPSHSAAPR